jgi:LysR family transcriptional regulator, chromosome initiation inhibitor
MDLQSDHLRALVAVIDHGTFDAAARELRLTPSAVSQRIKSLEIGVGRVLVQRTKPVRATVSGEVVLRLGRQIALLEHEAFLVLGDREQTPDQRVSMPIAVNADSLATWVLPALAQIPQDHRIFFAIHSEDESHTAELLKDGTVMAAITSAAEPVQGCSVRKLGKMRYRPMASQDFAARWFADGADVDSLAVAPMLVFDEKDDLQDRYLRRRTRRLLLPPRHHIPASADFARAIGLGLGWGMVPDTAQVTDGLVEIDADRFIDVPLYWQQWKLESNLLGLVADAIVDAARTYLR